MFNILINNLSLLSLKAQANNYLMCVDEWQKKPFRERTFQEMHTNEPIAHALIRKFANEEQGEKLNMILSLASKKVREELIFQEDKELDKELMNRLVDHLSTSEKEVVSLTHYAFYKKTIEKFTIDEYADDSEEGFVKNMPIMEIIKISNVPSVRDIQRAVVEMACKIICLYGQHNNECKLYMDYTGGDRTTSTIMIALTKMLEERGIKIDHIWAVNFDQSADIKEIHEKIEINYIFDFISGLYEFTNYGRADKLKEFWGESEINLPKAAREVNDKICDLADSMQLCRAKSIVEGIGGLVNAIKVYEKNSENSDQNELFQYLIDDIKNNYSLIYDVQQRTVPNIVRWCLNKNMVQQAVTIYTELIPEYIVNKKVLWYEGTIPDTGHIKDNSELAYNYINTYIWDTFARDHELHYLWNNNRYANSCKKKVGAIVDYIFDSDDPSNLTYTKSSITRQKIKNILGNYYIFRAMIRNLINHASNRSISLPNILENMSFNNDSKFMGENDKYITKLSPEVVKSIMYDMLDQIDEVVD